VTRRGIDDQRTPPEGWGYRIAPPASAPPPPSAPPGGSPPPRGLVGWVRKHPGAALGAIVLALAAGLAAGFLIGGNRSDEKKRSDEAGARVASLEKERQRLRGRLDTAEGRVAALRQRVRKLSARGEVPSFVGEQVRDAEADPSVATYNWKIRTSGEVSSETPGTVLHQSPAEGTSLGAGRSIALVVAKKAPRSEWVTIKTFTGADATKTDEFTIPRGARARVVYDMPTNTDNAILLYRPPRELVELLVNDVGPQKGSARLYDSGTFYLDVSGDYTIKVQVFRKPR
jgi:hypothetical protein